MKKCSTPNCTNKYRKCGYCGPCYYGHITYGDPTFRQKTVGIKTCTIPGCEGKHNARGYCKKHYRKWQEYGDPLHTIRETHHGPYCSELGCDKDHHSKGYCQTHFKRWRRKGHTGLNRNFKYTTERLP